MTAALCFIPAGSLGVVSWIGLIGMAVMIARFYRQTLSGKVVGSAVWFQVGNIVPYIIEI